MNATKYVVLIIIVSLTMVLSAQSTQAAPPTQNSDYGWRCSYHGDGVVYFYNLNGDGGLNKPKVPNLVGNYGPLRVWVSDHRIFHLVYWADFWIELFDSYGRLDCRVTEFTYVTLF